MEIRPFRALRFDEKAVGDPGTCISPPYDCISADDRAALCRKNDCNIVRLIKPEAEGGETRYAGAAALLAEWTERGVLRPDDTDCIYAYLQNYRLHGTEFERICFIALGRIEQFGSTVRPHESTLDEPIIDRLSLTRATGAVFGLIFMLYDDPRCIAEAIVLEQAARGSPLLDFRDDDGVRHRLLAINAADKIGAVAEMMRSKSCIIADGHHRYQTALAYFTRAPRPDGAFQMMAFANGRQDGLAILATHRLVANLGGFDMGRFVPKLRSNFEVTECGPGGANSGDPAWKPMLDRMRKALSAGETAFGVYGGGGFYVAVLKDRAVMDSAAPGRSSAWRRLDVSVLHKLVLEDLLGVDEKSLAAQRNVEYVRDTDAAVAESIARVDSGDKQVAFFMNPVTMEQLGSVTESGERMPQKSTFFYPKVYTGLTVQKL
jgi:uncharacterized protein (DUF1015 family)